MTSPARAVPRKLEGIDIGRPLTGPETVHIDVTNGCNTNCITCWDHSPLLTAPRSSAWKRQRVEAPAVEALLDDVRKLGGLKAIILSGMGDPFTHPDIYRMIAAVKSRGLHLTIITNLIPADPVKVLDLGVDQLLIGVHAASEGPYRAFHPSFKADEWTRLCDMLRRFQAAGRRYKHVQVVSRVNCHELVEMIRFAHDYSAAQVNFKLASLKDGTEACRITEDQRRLLAEELVPAAERLARELGVTHNLDVFADQLRAGGGATASIADVGCFMGYVYSRILVDGTVLYCCNTDVRVGTLAGGARFSELWYGEAWSAIRARMRRGDYFESCNQCGKLNQNVKLARRFAAAYGEARLREVIGEGPR
jgi:MoaA/NifB/PqqE/SkfB family radical SAM enzyme